MKGRILAAGTAAALLGAGTAWAALTQEGAPYPTEGNAPYTAYAADFNRDGLVDIATNNGDSRTFTVFLRQRGGGFIREAAPFSSASSNGAIGDFNGDGYPDFASAGFIGEGVGLALRDPVNGGFTTQTIPFQGQALSAIGAGDFNGDGRADMAVTDWNFSQATILLRNAANDNFDVVRNVATGPNPRQIAVADYNGDGRQDLAVLNNGSATVLVLLGNGAGDFGAEGVQYAVGRNPNGIAAGDFDGNGRPDLAVTNTADGTVTVLLRTAGNDGFAAGFGSPVAVGSSPLQIATTDFDRNGRTDIALASSAGLDVLLNTGAAFARDTPAPVEGAPNGVAVGDFNADGVPDAAVSSLTTNSITAFLSPSPAPPPPTPTATPTPSPTPVANRSVAVDSNGALIRRNGKFVPLADGIVSNGSEIDTRKGRVTITTAQGDKATFYDGIFKVTQSKGLTTLTLSEKLTGCPKATRSSASAAAKKPKTRKLWGDGKGKFRTKGTYSAATVRGTKWLVQDTCTTTTTRVTQGVIQVEDFVKHKKVTVRAKKSYIARKQKR